mgnify:CR=1 FL=1
MKKVFTLLLALYSLCATAGDTLNLKVSFPEIAMQGTETELTVEIDTPLTGSIHGGVNNNKTLFIFNSRFICI